MASSVGHKSPASALPPFVYKTVNTQEWATTGNTDTVTDSYVHSNSVVVIMNTSAHAGLWYVTVSEGSFVVTSSDAESATTTTYSYIVL